jgi:hypothetical protein
VRAWTDAVADPREGVAADAVALASDCGASLYVYGSVANGTVRPGLSDVDLLSVGLADPPGLGRILSARYAELCRWGKDLRRHGRGPGRRLRRRSRLDVPPFLAAAGDRGMSFGAACAAMDAAGSSTHPTASWPWLPVTAATCTCAIRS